MEGKTLYRKTFLIFVNGHAHMIVNIFFCLEGWELQLCCDVQGKLFEGHFGLTTKDCINEYNGNNEVFYWGIQRRRYFYFLLFSCVYRIFSSGWDM